MFESRITARAMEKLPVSEKSDANISSWSCDVEGLAKMCVKDIANWRTKQLNSNTKVATPCLDDTNSKKQKWDLLENCRKHAHKMF